MIWQSQEFDLTVEEAEEYAAQIGSLIAVSEVYGGLPSGGSAGEILIKNSDEDYDAVWSDIDSELPDVNSTDYGKVLTVSNDGVWNAQRPIFMVTITNNNNVFSADKTFSEITNAAIHNMMVVATYAGAYYQYCGIGGGTAIKQFVYIFTRNNIQTIKLFSVNISNVWTQYQYQLGTYSKPDSGIPASDLAEDVHLIPAGGSEGYVLKKNSNNDYDVIWAEDNITETEYFDFTWDGDHNPVPATGVTGEAIFDAITDGKLVFAKVTVGSSSYPYIFSLQAHYSNTYLDFISINGPIIYVLNYSTFFGQGSWRMFEYTIPDASTDTPQSLGVAAVGSSGAFARADHVHSMPSADDIGAIPAPDSVFEGDILTFSSDGWIASAPNEYIVTYTLGQTDTCDKTYNEIMAAVAAEQSVIARVTGIAIGQTANVYATQSGDMVAILTVSAGAMIRITHTSADTITWGWLGIDVTDIQGLGQLLAAYRTATDQDFIDQQQNAAIAGKYVKPASGIPKTDMAEDVQTSLGKANTALQQHQDISGKADKVTEVTVSTAGDVTQALDAGKVYHFTGALDALTLTLNSPAAGQQAQYHVDFVSGSAAPTVTIPATVTMPDGWTVEANTRYEIDILDGYGVAQSWEVTS